MEIKRDNDIDTVRFSFRFLFLSEESYNNIRHTLDNQNISYLSRRIDNKFNILINLEEIKVADTLLSVSSKVQEKYDIFISIRSTYDHGGLDVPDMILQIIRSTKCELNFSFFSA